MPHAMSRLNVTILDGDDQLTHWRGSPAAEGGALKPVDVTPVGGPPRFDYDTSGDDREQEKFTVETVILGADATEQNAFIAKYARGTVFVSGNISGLTSGRDYIVENALVQHNYDGTAPSMLRITLAEVGVTETP